MATRAEQQRVSQQRNNSAKKRSKQTAKAAAGSKPTPKAKPRAPLKRQARVPAARASGQTG